MTVGRGKNFEEKETKAILEILKNTEFTMHSRGRYKRFRWYSQEKMKNATIIIIPSLWEELFGLVAVEAMSNGIAIIASKVGGIPEIVKDNGMLIENMNF